MSKNPSDDPFVFDSFDWDDEPQRSSSQGDRDESPYARKNSRSKKSSSPLKWILIIMGGMGAFVLLCCGGGYWLVGDKFEEMQKNKQRDEVLYSKDVQGKEREAAVQKIQEMQDQRKDAISIKEAFDSDHVGVGENIQNQMDMFMKKLVRVSNTQNKDLFQSICHLDQNAQFIKESPFFPSGAKYVSYDEIQDWQRNLLYLSQVEITKYHLAHVDLSSSQQNAVVDCFFSFENDDVFYSYRLWLAREGGVWKLYDWHNLEESMRQSDQVAVIYNVALNHPETQNKYDQFLKELDLCNQIFDKEEGDEEDSTRNNQLAKNAIRRAEGIELPVILKSMQLFAAADYWGYLGCHRDVIRCLKKAEEYGNPIGLSFAYALNYSTLDQNKKALEYAKQYEAIAGRNPSVNLAKADAYLALGQLAQAIPEYQYVLTITPEDEESMRGLGIALGGGDLEILIKHLETLEKPTETAVQVFNTLYSSHDHPVKERLLKFIETKKPNSPEFFLMKERILNHQGESEKVEKLYLQAMNLETDEEKKAEYLFSYLDHMADSEKSIKGFQQVSKTNGKQAFNFFIDSIKNGEGIYLSEKEYKQLAKEYRQQGDENPWLHYLLGYLAGEKEEYTQAVQHYKQALKLAREQNLEDYDISHITLKLIKSQVLDDPESCVKIYQEHLERPEVFVEIASQFETKEKTKYLMPLIIEHRRLKSADPMISFYLGFMMENNAGEKELKENEVRAVEALYVKCLQQMNKNKINDWNQYKPIHKLIDFRIKNNLSLSSPVQVLQNKRYLQAVFRRLKHEEDWMQYEQLIARCQKSNPGTQLLALCLKWKAEMYRMQKKDRELILLMTPLLSTKLAHLKPYEKEPLINSLISALVRQKKFQHLSKLGMEQIERGDGENLMIAALIVQEDIDELSQFLQNSYSPGETVNTFLEQPEFAAIVSPETKEKIRQLYPPTFSNYVRHDKMFLLQRSQTLMDKDILQKTMESVLTGSVTVTRITNPSQAAIENSISFVVHSERETVVVTIGNQPYATLSDNPRIKGDTKKTEILKKHTGWIAIYLIHDLQRDSNTNFNRLAQITATLIDKKTDCLISNGNWKFCTENRSAIIRELKKGTSAKAFFKENNAGYLFQSEERSAALKRLNKKEQQARRRLEKNAIEFSKHASNKRLVIEVKQTLGEATFYSKLTVDKVSFNKYGNTEFHCRWNTDSPLQPDLKRGSSIIVSRYSITDFRYAKAVNNGWGAID